MSTQTINWLLGLLFYRGCHVALDMLWKIVRRVKTNIFYSMTMGLKWIVFWLFVFIIKFHCSNTRYNTEINIKCNLACINYGNAVLGKKLVILIYFHNLSRLKSCMSNFTKLSGEMKTFIDAQFVVNFIKSPKIPHFHLSKLVWKQPFYDWLYLWETTLNCTICLCFNIIVAVAMAQFHYGCSWKQLANIKHLRKPPWFKLLYLKGDTRQHH